MMVEVCGFGKNKLEIDRKITHHDEIWASCLHQLSNRMKYFIRNKSLFIIH